MLKLDHFTLREINLDLVDPFQTSSGVTTSRRILLIESKDSDGQIVWSECVAGEIPNYSPETIDTAWHIITHYLIPQIKSVSFETPSDASRMLQSYVKGHNMAKAALEMAYWNLAATQRNMSLARYLGGVNKQLPTGISIGMQPSPEMLLEKTISYLEAGYKKIKIKIKPGHDLEYVKYLRNKLGYDFRLMVDANNAYTIEDIAHLKKFDPYNLLMIEQPLAWDDVYQHAKLQKEIKTPVCLDESITQLSKAQEMIELDSGRIINIKPGRVGGLYESKAIHDLCQAHNIPVWCGGMLEAGIGRAYNVALSSLPNFTLPGDLSPSKRYWKEDIVSPEWDMDKDGWMIVPFDKPGLGVTINTDFIEYKTIRKEVVF